MTKKQKTYCFIAVVFLAGVFVGTTLQPPPPPNPGVFKTLGTPCSSMDTGYYSKTFKVTAYCDKECCCGDYADGFFANGVATDTVSYAIAAPKSIDFGTLISVPGYADSMYVPVLDRGGAITDDGITCLDLYYGDIIIKGLGEHGYISGHQRAELWGVQYVECKVKI